MDNKYSNDIKMRGQTARKTSHFREESCLILVAFNLRTSAITAAWHNNVSLYNLKLRDLHCAYLSFNTMYYALVFM